MSNGREHQREMSFAGDVRFVAGVLRSDARLIAIFAGGAVVLALLYLALTPKVYAAKSVIQIEQEAQRVVKIEEVRTDDLKSPESLETFAQDVTSPEVLLRVVHDPALASDPAFLPEAERKTDNALQEALARHIDVKVRRGTRLIDLTVEHRSPALAQRIATLLVREFAAWNLEARRDAGQNASRFLMDEAAQLRERLAKSEQALQTYKEANGTVSLEDKQNITVEKLKELNLLVTKAKTERLKIESDCNQIQTGHAQSLDQLLAIPGVANSVAVAALEKVVSEKEAGIATLHERYLPRHPKMIEAQSELNKFRSELEQAAHIAADVLVSSYQAASIDEQKLTDALGEQQALALELNKIAIPYAALTRDMESDRSLYDAVLTRLKETDITKEIADDPIRVVARPLLPDRPVKPQKKLVLALGVIAGTFAGFGVAFARHAADRSLRTLHEAEKRLGLDSLGEIPTLTAGGRVPNGALLLTDSEPAAEESFRTLRISLSLIGSEYKTFLFTSAQPGEGKTFCAMNCAISFAHLGLKTLLLDANSWPPHVRQLLLDGAAVRGLRNLAGDWENDIQQTTVPNLWVASLSGGSVELPARTTFAQFLRHFETRFDRIVVDGAPVVSVSDTLLFAKHVDAVCLVIHAGHTPAEDVTRATQRLARAGASVAGFVWNQAKTGSGNYRAANSIPILADHRQPGTQPALRGSDPMNSNGGNPS